MKTHYEVLGVTPASDREAVRRAYVDLARRHHPDAGGDPIAMRAVNDAWRTLADPARRARYDAALGLAPRPASGAPLDVEGDLDDVDDPCSDGADLDGFGADSFAARPPRRSASLADTASLLAVLTLAVLAALSLLFGMMLTIGELLGLGVFLAFLTGIAVVARMLLAMRTGR